MQEMKEELAEIKQQGKELAIKQFNTNFAMLFDRSSTNLSRQLSRKTTALNIDEINKNKRIS